MKLKHGLCLHTAEVAMGLYLESKEDKKMVKKIVKGVPVITLEHFIAPISDSNEAAVVIQQGTKLKQAFIGKWELHKEIKRTIQERYFKFTPKYEVKPHLIYTLDQFPDDYYLEYSYKIYKKISNSGGRGNNK